MSQPLPHNPNMNPPTENTHLAVQESQLGEYHAPQQPSIGSILAGVIEKGVSEQNVGVLEKLLDLYDRVELRNAEKEFNTAFTKLQQDLPTIIAKSKIPNRGLYEKYEDIMAVVGPLLTKHGFSVSFDMEPTDNRVTVRCTLRHLAGHSKTNSFAVRVGKADSETQADCKAATTSKRNALVQALSLVIRQDALIDDGDVGLEGEVLSPDRALFLREQLREVGGNETGFLAVAGVDSWDKITSGSYDVLLRMINSKRKAK